MMMMMMITNDKNIYLGRLGWSNGEQVRLANLHE